MNNIDKIFYINLDYRTDRNDQMLQQFDQYNIPPTRFSRISAVRSPPGYGYIGCAQSHLAALQEAKKDPTVVHNVLILEDDFQFVVDPETLNQQLDAFFNKEPNTPPFDVLFFSYNMKQENPLQADIHPDLLWCAKNVQTASGYLVNAHYINTLVDLLVENNALLETTHKHWLYANDQCWKSLQETDRWYCFKNRLGIQRPSFSDNTQEYIVPAF